MKQIVVISGKGGTGKTVLTGAFAALAKNKVMVDCDVDAADLHLLLQPTIQEKHIFKSGVTALIDEKKCIRCLKCQQRCHFDAINDNLEIDPIACEGCGFCYHLCPVGAIELKKNISGEWFISETQYGPFVHAKLGIAEENSGKLISLIRQKAVQLAEKENSDWVLIDGAPGISCPVIACLSGVDCALVVIEPTLSGLHDAKRVIQVAKHFQVPVKIVINKYDLNALVVKTIEQYGKIQSIPIIGKIPFDPIMVKSVVQGQTIMACKEKQAHPIQVEIQSIWKNL